MRTNRLRRDEALLAVIDVQEKLAPVIHDIESVMRNLERLIRGTHLLGVPMVITEQYVKGLGPTSARLREVAASTHGYEPVEKMCFSANACEGFAQQLKTSDRRKIILAGVETHVCVYQTAIDLLHAGYEVHLVADAVSSRTLANKEVAIQRMLQEGVKLTSTEMVLLEMTVKSGTDEFRAISKLIK
jgi:nicotinamidase-related amidase